MSHTAAMVFASAASTLGTDFQRGRRAKSVLDLYSFSALDCVALGFFPRLLSLANVVEMIHLIIYFQNQPHGETD